MNRRPSDTQEFTDEEVARRRDEALLRALSTPPKPHSEMKVGKRKAKTGNSAPKRSAKKDAANPDGVP